MEIICPFHGRRLYCGNPNPVSRLSGFGGSSVSMSNKLQIHAIGDASIVRFQDVSVLDRAAAQQISESLRCLVDDQACRKIVVDLSNVHLLSSAALGILIDLKKKVDASKGQVILCSISQELMKALIRTQLYRMFTFCPTGDQALAVLGVATAS
jgi:anti-anti-sigma factor